MVRWLEGRLEPPNHLTTYFGSSQAQAELLGQNLDVRLLDHGVVLSGNEMNIDGSGQLECLP